jgi:AcrR family transcriptional regulator
MNTDSHFEARRVVSAAGRDMPVPMQERSRETANRFIQAATELLHHKTFAELSVAELAEAAGRSIGVFYQRFGNKDEFLDVLLSAYLEFSNGWRSSYEPQGNLAEVYSAFLERGYQNLRDNRNLWHAALERAALDREFWDRYGHFRMEGAKFTRRALERALGREFTDEERRRLALASQVFNSVINNSIINGPGPLMLENDDFFPELKNIALTIAKLPEA